MDRGPMWLAVFPHTLMRQRERPPPMFGRNTEAKSATNGIHVQTVTNTPRTILEFYSGLSLQENVHLCVVYYSNRLLMEDLDL